MSDVTRQRAFQELQKTLQELPDHMILLEGEIMVDLPRISKDVLKEYLNINAERLQAIKKEINIFQAQYKHLGADVRTAKGFIEVKEQFHTLIELQKYQKLVCLRINKEFRRRKNANKQFNLRTFERAFMDRAKATLSTTLFERLQNEALEELQAETERIPPSNVAYEASIARAIEAKRAISRDAIDTANASRRDTPNDQPSSVYTLIGGLPSLGKRR